MNSLTFGGQGPKTILCIGAHCDDIEIGCGGTLLTLAERYPQAQFQWVIFASEGTREGESREAAQKLLGSRCTVDIQKFRGSYLPFEGAKVKDYFEVVAGRVKASAPEAIFTHCLQDRHQDHKFLAELTWNTFRNHTIFEYEIPKYEGDLGNPNFYVPLTEGTVNRKADMLMESFPTQLSRTWFKRDLFLAHLRLRGIECNSPSGYAEAFHARKLTL